MMVSSASPESRMVDDVVVLLGVELRVEQQAAHADHRVHRRADLVAHRGEERALGLVGRLRRGARFLGFVEQARVLDRDHRLVGEGLQQSDLLRRKRRPLAVRERADDEESANTTVPPHHWRNQAGKIADLGCHAANRLGNPIPRQCIGIMHHAALQHRLRDDGLGDGGRLELLCGPLAARSARQTQVHHGVLVDGQHCQVAACDQALAAVEDLLEHRLGIGHRAADDLQHLGGGGLLFERLLRLVEQAHVLDRDHRLVGEGLRRARFRRVQTDAPRCAAGRSRRPLRPRAATAR